jgi:predicted MFS family arabinose efflux permease
MGLYTTTVLMSIGFHYYETVQSSLALQWVDQARAPETLGRIIAVGALTSIAAFALIWLADELLGLDFRWIYLLGGGLTVALALLAWRAFPRFPEAVEQHRHMFLRRRYWLYYALVFLSGARRQIFIVFAGFLMVQKFHYSVSEIALLFLVNATVNVLFAARIGRGIGRVGERAALLFEYAGLVVVFAGYAVVQHAGIAALLYVVDHLFFALAIAIKTYFQKIADPRDIAATAGVSFTINHVAAVIIPAAFGALWLIAPAAVFLCGALMAGLSLLLSLNVPPQPAPGNEVVLGRVLAPAASAAEG